MSVNKVQLANGETIIDISDSTVTPETLAEGVTAHDASGQKITGKMVPGGGASVQTDWNQTDETAADFIKNKPFGEMYGDTVTFDGETDGVTNAYEMAFKVSDAVPTYDDITKGGYSVINGANTPFEENEFIKDEIVMPSGIMAIGPIFIVPLDMAGVEDPDIGLAFPESGTYFMYSSIYGAFVTELQINGYNGFLNTKQLEKKYIPSELPILYTNQTTDTTRYLYTNAECTEKARKGDIPYGSIFLVALCAETGSVLKYFFPDSCDSKIFAEANGYAEIFISNITEIVRLYTAEYTP